MFYLYSSVPNAAQLPRILAEDVLTPELRSCEIRTRKSFKLRLPKRHPQENEVRRPCTCPKMCTAGSH